MSGYYDKIREIREKLYLKKFSDELEYIESIQNDENGENGDEVLNDRVKLLNLIMTQYKDRINRTGPVKKVSRFNEIEEHMFKRTWTKLPCMHKDMKINEYLITLIKNKKERKRIHKLLTTAVYDKKINSKKFVDYDSVNGIIKKINILHYDEDNEVYVVKL